MDALDIRLCEIADQCKDETELGRLKALVVQVIVWRNEAGNKPVNKTRFTYEQFVNNLFGELKEDIEHGSIRIFPDRCGIKSYIEQEAKCRQAT